MKKNTNNKQNLDKNSRPGYEYLTGYQLGKVIQELTNEFCLIFLRDPKDPNYPNTKLIEQMNGAARSNPQNVAEGYAHESLKGYLYLVGIAKGSNEELAKDYEDFLKARGLEIWGREDLKIRGFRDFRVRWLSQTNLNTPQLPQNPEQAANMLLTYCSMEGYLLQRLADSLRDKYMKEGGMTENLYKARVEYRRRNA